MGEIDLGSPLRFRRVKGEGRNWRSLIVRVNLIAGIPVKALGFEEGASCPVTPHLFCGVKHGIREGAKQERHPSELLDIARLLGAEAEKDARKRGADLARGNASSFKRNECLAQLVFNALARKAIVKKRAGLRSGQVGFLFGHGAISFDSTWHGDSALSRKLTGED